jgi:hypothetical protein
VQVSGSAFSPLSHEESPSSKIPLPRVRTARDLFRTHILVSFEAEPPTTFWTRSEASSVRSSSSWVRRSCLFLQR